MLQHRSRNLESAHDGLREQDYTLGPYLGDRGHVFSLCREAQEGPSRRWRVGMGWWGGGIGLWGWGRFSRQPSSPPCPLGPGCQTQNCLKTSASSPKGAIFISFEDGSNLMQIPCSAVQFLSFTRSVFLQVETTS